MEATRPFSTVLESLLKLSHQKDEISAREVFEILSCQGYATLLIICSLPFCLPIQIPGFSTPFGILLGFIGLRIAFAQHLWWPEWILTKTIKSKSFEVLIKKVIKVVEFLQKILKPRLVTLTQNSLFLRMHGLLVFVLAVLLSLPLPIPMTNMLAATPILFIGFGLLENDGVFILVGYCLAFLCFIAFWGLFYLGKAQLGFLLGG